MKLIFVFTALFYTAFCTFSQINVNGGYLMGNNIEVGVNNNGHEGTFDLVGSHSRSGVTSPEVYFGFVSNPQLNAWATYDGDFFTPGTPENGFGIELNGINYSNNANNTATFGTLQNEIPGALTNYTQNGDCLELEWIGNVNNVQVKVVYKMVTTNLYYTTEVTLTNNTGADLTNLYYYRNLDPDNNQPLSGSYVTQNTVVFQPTPACEKALVSATQTNPWSSYLGLGAIGTEFRVSYGGFSNRDASDIWNGVAGLTGTVGSTTLADDAISLAHRTPTLLNGASETFSFVVVLDGAQIDDAFNSLIYFDYTGGLGGPVTPCAAVVDTAYSCPGSPVNISINGSTASAYNWTWSPPTALSSTVGGAVIASPTSTTTYTATGTPIGGCVSNIVTMDIIVEMGTFASSGDDSSTVLCANSGIVTLNTFLSSSAISTGTWSELTSSAQFDTATTEFQTNGLPIGVYNFQYITPASAFCPEDTAFFSIDLGDSNYSAGLDSTISVCLNATPVDLNNLLNGADNWGVFEEITNSNQFDSITGIFDPTGLPAQTLDFIYTVSGCASTDTSEFSVIINTALTIDAGSDVEICINEPVTVNGSGPATIYNWNNSVVDGTPFYPVTSQYYTVIGTDAYGCIGTDSLFVTVRDLPTPNFVADTAQACVYSTINFLNTSSNSVQCIWKIDGVVADTVCNGFSYDFNSSGLYDVELLATSVYGCKDTLLYTDYIYIEDYPESAPSYYNIEITSLQAETVNFINNSTGANSYVWSFGDGSGNSVLFEPSHEYDSPVIADFEIMLIASSPIGCLDTAYTVVSISEELIYFIPNSFTPDGDEFNNTFQPVFTSGYDPYGFHMQIYDRWGELLFESHDASIGWDGTYHGRIVKPGIYNWTITFKLKITDDVQRINGHINLIK